MPVDPGELKPGQRDQRSPVRTGFDYSRDGVLRSLEPSRKRLEAAQVDMRAIHDPDEGANVDPGVELFTRSDFKAAMDGRFPTRAGLRGQGVVDAVDVGINPRQILRDCAAAGEFDYFLPAGRYALMDQDSMLHLCPLWERRWINLDIGRPYCSGILASGAIDGAACVYRPAPPPAARDRVRKIEAHCARHGVSLQAAARQFPLHHPLAAGVIPGARSVAEGEANLVFQYAPVPPRFREEVGHELMIDEAAPVGS